MQKFTFILLIGVVLVFGLTISNFASDKYDPEEFGVESVEETGTPMGINKHPGDNDFDMFWDNFDSSDPIADDVTGLTVTDTTNDLDNDGFAEIICSDEDGFTYVFENTADNTFDLVWSAEVVTSPGSHGYAPVAIADLDGDGLQEIVATFEDSAGIYFYEWDGVDGSDNYVEVAFLDLPYDSYDNCRDMVVDNLDSDINQELIISQGDTCYVFEADASFNFTNEAKMWGGLLDEVHSVITADLNNNGIKEVIFCDWNYSAIHIWENTAEDTYASVLVDTMGFMLDTEDGRAYEMIITNIDGDSYPELFAVTSTDKIILFEMQSSSWDTSSSNMMHTILLDMGSDINNISSGDIDEDGNPDLYFVSDDNHVYDWEFTGGDIFDPLNYTEYDIGELNGANAEEVIYAGDLDGDGERELVVGYEGTSSFPLLYFLEHHVIPAVPTLSLSRTELFFDHVWNIAEIDTEIVVLENIGTVDCIVDSIVASDPAFTSYLANITITALGSEDLEIYFTAPDNAIHDSVYYVIYSNSSTAPDTINVYGDSREKPLLYINEFQPKGTEWIELYYDGSTVLDLIDIGITNGEWSSARPPEIFGTPDWGNMEFLAEDIDWGPSGNIAPGTILLSMTTDIPSHNGQDWLYLTFRDSAVIDVVSYGAVGPAPLFYLFSGDSITAGSIARTSYVGTGADYWTIDFDATPGLPNDAPAPNLGSSIIINEVDYSENVDGQWEWIEFYNPTGSDISMNGWRFSDGDDLFIINGLTVPAMGLAAWHDSTSLSIAAGDVAYLFDDNGVRLDQIGFADFNPVEKALIGTLQRIPDGAGPNDGYNYLTSGGGVTWFDRTHTMGGYNSVTYAVFTAQVGGDANYRSFWMNGSWDSSGVYDPNWSGPMLELKNDGIWPDTSAADNIFTGVTQLLAGTTYNWWVGSENSTSSFLEDGAAITPDTVTFNYSTTCVVDPSDAGFNDWVIGVAGDSLNNWNNSSDDLTRNGWEWSGNFALPAGPMEYKFVVMHSWSAGYGVGGVGGGNIQYAVPAAGDYTITFNDSTDAYSITEFIDEESVTITTPEITTSVTNEGTIGMLNDTGGSPGFTWSGSGQLLYEGSLLVATSPDHVVDASRAVINGSSANGLDEDYQFLEGVNVIHDDADSTILQTSFDDSRAGLAPLADDGPNTPIGIEIDQTTYCYGDATNSGYVIYKLDITNTTAAQLDGIVAGAYFDWDLGTWDANTGQVDFNSVTIAGVNGGAAFDAEFAYIYDPAAPTMYMGSVPLNQNYFSASRVLHQPDEVYTVNFTEANKYMYMVDRRGSDPYGPGGVTQDKGLMFGLGGGTGGAGTVPDSGFTIPAGGTVTVAFAIVGGNDMTDFVDNGTAALQKWADMGNSITIFEFVTGIDDELAGIPAEFALHQNYPNPFNPTTTIKYDLKQNTDVLIIVYDMLGREVRTVINETQNAGYKNVVWDGTNNSGKQVSTGVYFYKIVAGDFVKTMKMILMK